MVNKKTPTPAPAESAASPQRKESLARSDEVATPLGVTASEPPRSENSFTSDEIPLEMAEREVHYQTSVDSPVMEVRHNEIAHEAEENHHIPSEVEETTVVNEVDVVIEPSAPVPVQAEHASEEESAAEIIAKDVIVTAPTPTPAAEEQLISPVPKSSEVDTVPIAEIASPPAPAPHTEGGASLADELAGVFGGPSPMANPLAAHEVVEHDTHASPLIDVAAPQQAALQHTEISQQERMPENPIVEKTAEVTPVEKPAEVPHAERPAQVSYENPLIDFHTGGEEVKPVVNATAEHVHTENITNHIRTNGIEHQPHPEISADLPGTVPSKETEGSTLRKVPTPPNEFIISTQAHRLRREQEQKEIDERKARIAAILAKSRDLSSGTPTVGGRISPPKGGTAQDVLKRLASNGNLPALQKLVARHTPEPPTIDQKLKAAKNTYANFRIPKI
ncbi:hypothetical protein OESDEN_03763 [Oesophagostomum dentatum]|uniref:Uncharacterized protein n=1 Tax=Oesophagostomum dentatum TaxID=61180 RepID=A0A0B1TJK6_OESDE|nr:hypothetical protein OESDEN_03763 [Oesophagostomum dentatum]